MNRNKEIRPAQLEDLMEIMDIYDYAKKFMARTGNPTQWAGAYPQRELLEGDIKNGGLYVVTEAGKICGVFYFVIGPDPTYSIIENGGWHSAEAYGTIHRIAGNGTGGIFGAALDFCRERIGYLRIDTHADNKVMQHVVSKHGFRPCGIIYTHDGSPRIAFDRIEEDAYGQSE